MVHDTKMFKDRTLNHKTHGWISWLNTWRLSESSGALQWPQVWKRFLNSRRWLLDAPKCILPSLSQSEKGNYHLPPNTQLLQDFSFYPTLLPVLFPTLFNQSTSSGSVSSEPWVLQGAGPVLAGQGSGLEPRLLWFPPPSFSCGNTAQKDYAGGLITWLHVCFAGNSSGPFMCHFL